MILNVITSLTICISSAVGVAHFCIMQDTWNKTCREQYMPPWLKSSEGYAAILIVSPIGFFIAMYYAVNMLRNPAVPPEWVQTLVDKKEY